MKFVRFFSVSVCFCLFLFVFVLVLLSVHVLRFSASLLRDDKRISFRIPGFKKKYFQCISPLGQFSHRVAMSVCLSVCLFSCDKTPTSRCPGDFWSKGISLILACLLLASLLWIMAELGGGGSVTVAVGVSDM